MDETGGCKKLPGTNSSAVEGCMSLKHFDWHDLDIFLELFKCLRCLNALPRLHLNPPNSAESGHGPLKLFPTTDLLYPN
jgi:hypothetical protein